MSNKHWTETVRVGDEVSYRSVGQWFQRGKVISIGKGKQGGDCVVEWQRSGIKSEECLANLYSWRDESVLTHFVCLACGYGRYIAEGDALPRSDERCSHEWEEQGAA